MRILYTIVHYGDSTLTIKCLNSLKTNDYSNVLIIDIPNKKLKTVIFASEASTESNFNYRLNLHHIFNAYSGIKVYSPSSNYGYAYACNLGIHYLKMKKYDYILLCNNDITFPDKFKNKLNTYLQKTHIDIAGLIIKDFNNKIWFDGGEIDPFRWSGGHKKGKTDYVSGCAMIISKNVINQLGLFDISYGMYYEDVDYCYRAKMLGFTISVIPIKITHYINKNRNSYDLMEYYLSKNRLKFMKKFASKKIIHREIFRSPKTVWEYVINHNWEGLKGFIKGIISYQ